MSYKIKPLVWVEGWGEEEPYLSAKTIRDDQYDIWGSDEHGYSANLMDDGCELGYYPTLQEVKNACQQHHEKRIEDLLCDFIYPDNEVNKWNTVIDGKAFVVSQIGAVENLIKCAQENGDLVAVVQLKQKLQELKESGK